MANTFVNQEAWGCSSFVGQMADYPIDEYKRYNTVRAEMYAQEDRRYRLVNRLLTFAFFTLLLAGVLTNL